MARTFLGKSVVGGLSMTDAAVPGGQPLRPPRARLAATLPLLAIALTASFAAATVPAAASSPTPGAPTAKGATTAASGKTATTGAKPVTCTPTPTRVQRKPRGPLTEANAKAVLAGYLTYDGDVSGRIMGYRTVSMPIAMRVLDAAHVLGYRAVLHRERRGKLPLHVPVEESPSTLELEPNVVPDWIMSSTDIEALTYFFAAMIESEGSTAGLMLDTPYPAFAVQTAQVLKTKLCLHPILVGSGGYARIYAPRQDWATIESWPYVARGRVPGEGHHRSGPE